MINKIAVILTSLFLVSCSPGIVNQTVPDGRKNLVDKQKAESLFIEGSIFEIKGEYNEAIVRFLEAVKFDPQPGIFYGLAKNYYRINKLSSALVYSKKAVEDDSSNVEFLTLHATIYSASHLTDSAETIYRKILNLEPANVTAYYNLAQLSESNKPSLALFYYKKIIDLLGPEWNVLIKIADINERLGNIDETITTVEELLAMNPSDLQLQKLLIESYIKTKKYDSAFRLIDEAQVSFPDDPNLIELRGNAFIQQERWKEAGAQYIKLIKIPEISFENKIRIGTAFYLQGEKDSSAFDPAVEIFKAINRDTVDWQVNAYLGEIEVRRGNDSAAVEYLKVAAKLAEWNGQVWVRLGGILFDSRRYKESIEFMSAASDKFPNDFAVNLIYGLSLSSDNQHLKAKEALKRALNLNPNDMTALSAYGFTLNQLKEDDEALVTLNRALTIEPKNLQVISIIAMIHESRKDYPVSDSLYTEAIKIDSNNVLLLNNFAYSLAERGKSLDEALKMAKKAIASEPGNSSYLDTIGWIYFRLGDFKNAKKHIEEATKIEDKNATLVDHLGDVYFKLGNRVKAVELWKKAFEFDSTKIEIRNKIEKGEL
ncbi:MAG: hypothetical protein WC061_09670 [Melioribacteraceae bacterium]